MPEAETCSFADLIAPPDAGRAPRVAHRQPRQRPGVSELRIVCHGRTITVAMAGEKMEAISGQLLFDFETSGLGDLRAFPERKPDLGALRRRDAESWFQRGLELEETGAPVEQALEAYRKAVELNPSASGAWVNLGTIHYRQRDFKAAEEFYLRAIEADPAYPLAEFNLGNLYDEVGRAADAFDHYNRALRLNASYADAHFNLALLCERTGDVMKAVHHWKLYLKLDSAGQWAEIARRQLDRLRDAALVHSR